MDLVEHEPAEVITKGQLVPERKPRFLVGWVEPLDFVGFRASTQPTKINQLKELNLLGRNPTNRFNGFSFRH